MMSPTETPFGPRGRVTFTCKDNAVVYVDKTGGPKWASETEKDCFKSVAMEFIQDPSECGISYCGQWVWISLCGHGSDRSPAPEPSRTRYSPWFPPSGHRSAQIYSDTLLSPGTLCCHHNCGKYSTQHAVIHCVNEISRNGSKERCLKKKKKKKPKCPGWISISWGY